MESRVQLVDRDGEFNEKGLDGFVQRNQLSGEVMVVTIIGPQSSGKSTLLNHMFGTNFEVMDEAHGRKQTTQGVWLAKVNGLKPCTLVMDFEGSDGAERGEDDTLFERQAALFALAVSNIMLINMWYTDIGREKAAGRPLLKTIFQVMVRRLSRRKITLMLVIRDVPTRIFKNPESSERLELDLVKSLEDIWKTADLTSDLKGASLQEFFSVKVTLLINFEDRPLRFGRQVTMLRNSFQNSTDSGGLAGAISNSVPGTAVSLHFKSLWQMIKQNKDLDLPSLRVMVATVRCDEITKEELQKLRSDVELFSLIQDASQGLIEGMWRTVRASVNKSLDKYAEETAYLDDSTKKSKLEYFISEVRNFLQPSHSYQIKYLQKQALSEFKRSIDTIIRSSELVKDHLPNVRQAALDLFNRGRKDACLEWDPSMGEGEFNEASQNLFDDMSTYVLEKRTSKLSGSISSSEKVLDGSLSTAVGALLAESGKSTTDTWPLIRNRVKAAVARELSKCKDEFGRNFDPTKEERRMMQKSLEGHGQGIVEAKVKAGIPRLVDQLIDRFTSIFSQDEFNRARQWSSRENDIQTISRDAKSSSLRLLTTYAVTKLVEKSAEDNDGVDIDCVNALVPHPENLFGRFKRYWNGTESPEMKRDEVLLKLSGGTSWRNISEGDTLITPSEFKCMWISFEFRTHGPIAKAFEDKRKALRNAFC